MRIKDDRSVGQRTAHPDVIQNHSYTPSTDLHALVGKSCGPKPFYGCCLKCFLLNIAMLTI